MRVTPEDAASLEHHKISLSLVSHYIKEKAINANLNFLGNNVLDAVFVDGCESLRVNSKDIN